MAKRLTEPVIVFEPRYSGPLSIAFWEAIHATGDMVLYGFACALQDVEARVLNALTAPPKVKRTRRHAGEA